MRTPQHPGYRLTPCCALCMHSEYFGGPDWDEIALVCMLGVTLVQNAPLTKEYYLCDKWTPPNEKTATAMAETGKAE